MMEHLPEIAIAAALAWASGLRLYLTLFLVGLAGKFGWMVLPEHLELLSSPLVLSASGFMTCVEFFADKIPWVDSVWDAVNTFVRVPGGALLAAAMVGDSGAGAALAGAIIGGTITAGTHLAKAGAGRRQYVARAILQFREVQRRGPPGAGRPLDGVHRARDIPDRPRSVSRTHRVGVADAVARRAAGSGVWSIER